MTNQRLNRCRRQKIPCDDDPTYIFQAEGLVNPHQFFTRDRNHRSSNAYKYISHPQIQPADAAQGIEKAYFWALCLNDGEQPEHVPVMVLLNECPPYKEFLIRTNNYQCLYEASKVTQKGRAKCRRKYFKKGEQIAFKLVFRQTLYDVGAKIKRRCVSENFCARSFVAHSQTHPRVMSSFGRSHLTEFCESVEIDGDNVQFQKCEHQIFGRELKTSSRRGTFEAYNVVGVYSTSEHTLNFTFNIKYTDLNGRTHYEKTVL